MPRNDITIITRLREAAKAARDARAVSQAISGIGDASEATGARARTAATGVDVMTGKAKGLSTSFDAVSKRAKDATFGMSNAGSAAATAGGLLSRVPGAFAAITPAAAGAGTAATSAAGGLSSMGTTILGMSPPVAALVIGLGVNLVAAIAAIGASAAAAALGLAALGVAAGGIWAVGMGVAAVATMRFEQQSTKAGTAAFGLAKTASSAMHQINQAFGPGIDLIFRGLQGAIRTLMPTILKMQGPVRQLGAALGTAFGAVAKALAGGGVGEMLILFTHALTGLIPIGTKLAVALIRPLTVVAATALPRLIGLVNMVAKAFTSWLNGLSTADIANFVTMLISQFRTWMGLGMQIGRIFIAIFPTLAVIGQQLVRVLATGAKVLADWLTSAQGQATLKQMFAALPTVIGLVVSALRVGLSAFSTFMSVMRGIAPIARTVANVVVGAFNGLAGFLAPGLRLIGSIIRSVFSGAVAYVRGTIGAFRSAASAIGSAISAGFSVIRHIVSTVRGVFGDVVGFVRSMPGRIRAAATGMWNGITSAFRGAINTIIIGWNRLRFAVGGASIHIGKVGAGPLAVDFGNITIPSFALNTPDIATLAAGGNVMRAGTALVGERGPEVLSLPAGARVEPLSPRSVAPVGGWMDDFTFEIDVPAVFMLDSRVLAEATAKVVAKHRATR